MGANVAQQAESVQSWMGVVLAEHSRKEHLGWVAGGDGTGGA